MIRPGLAVRVDPVRLLFLPNTNLSDPLYLAIIQRPKTEVWYAKSRMGANKLASIMKTLAQALNLEAKRISNHSTRKSVVAKLKKVGQPRHKIIQITGHANESSVDDYDEIEEDERRALSHIISGYPGTDTKTTMSETLPSSSSATVLPSSHAVLVPSSSASTLASTEQTSAQFSTHQATHPPPQIPVTHTLNESAGHHFNNCTVDLQNYFGPQSTNQASSSRVECQIGELARSPSIPRRKRRRAYIIDSDED